MDFLAVGVPRGFSRPVAQGTRLVPAVHRPLYISDGGVDAAVPVAPFARHAVEKLRPLDVLHAGVAESVAPALIVLVSAPHAPITVG